MTGVTTFARGFSGGSRSFSSHSYSSPSRSTSTSRTSVNSRSSTPSKTSTRSTSTSKTTRSSTAGAKGKATTTRPATKSLNGRNLSAGHTVTHEHFHNYSAPAGSVVYYRQSSALDYLPWIFLFSQHNSPNAPQAVVVQPDGRQVTTQESHHVDGMYVFEVLIMLALVGAILFGLWKIIKKARSL